MSSTLRAALVASCFCSAVGGTAFANSHYEIVGFTPSNAFDGFSAPQYISATYPGSEVTLGYTFDTPRTVTRYTIIYSSGNGLLEDRSPRRWLIEGLGGECGAAWTVLSVVPVDMTVAQWEARSYKWGPSYLLPMMAVNTPKSCLSYRIRVTTGNTVNGVIKNIAIGELVLDSGCPAPKTCWDGKVRYADPECNMRACPPCSPATQYCGPGYPYEESFAPRDPENNCQFTCPAPRCRGEQQTCPDGSLVFRQITLQCNFAACPTPDGNGGGGVGGGGGGGGGGGAV